MEEGKIEKAKNFGDRNTWLFYRMVILFVILFGSDYKLFQYAI